MRNQYTLSKTWQILGCLSYYQLNGDCVHFIQFFHSLLLILTPSFPFRYQYLYDSDPREEMRQIGTRGVIFNYAGFIPQMVWDQ